MCRASLNPFNSRSFPTSGGQFKRISDEEQQLLKRRQAIEPIIGPLKQDHRMDRCHLKGGRQVARRVVCSELKICWLLRMIAKNGIPFLTKLYLCLRAAINFVVTQSE